MANLALFCDFENIALGVRDSKYAKFDMKPVLERLLVKGSIVVKKALALPLPTESVSPYPAPWVMSPIVLTKISFPSCQGR